MGHIRMVSPEKLKHIRILATDTRSYSGKISEYEADMKL